MDEYSAGRPREGRRLEVSASSITVARHTSPCLFRDDSWSTFWHMVLHGLEGSTRARLSLPEDGAIPDTHSAFSFASEKLQPPLISVIKNVEYCVASFHKRQQDESRYELHLKLRHRVVGEESLETVRDVLDRVCQLLLDERNVDK